MSGLALPFAVAASGVTAFVLGALDGTSAELAFAASGLGLVVAACAGPFCFGDGVARAALRCTVLGLCMGLACLAVGHSAAAFWCGAFTGLYAFALGAFAHLLRWPAARVVVALLGVALLATLHFWDDLGLLSVGDRKVSADTAFHLNAAAAVSVTLHFDWLHAKALYTDNQTAESMFGLKLDGIGPFAVRLLLLAGLSLLPGWLRARRSA